MKGCCNAYLAVFSTGLKPKSEIERPFMVRDSIFPIAQNYTNTVLSYEQTSSPGAILSAFNHMIIMVFTG